MPRDQLTLAAQLAGSPIWGPDEAKKTAEAPPRTCAGVWRACMAVAGRAVCWCCLKTRTNPAQRLKVGDKLPDGRILESVENNQIVVREKRSGRRLESNPVNRLLVSMALAGLLVACSSLPDPLIPPKLKVVEPQSAASAAEAGSAKVGSCGPPRCRSRPSNRCPARHSSAMHRTRHSARQRQTKARWPPSTCSKCRSAPLCRWCSPRS